MRTTSTPIAATTLLALLLAGAGCADSALGGWEDQAPTGPFPSAAARGVVFVGTDMDFTENVFVMDADDPSSILNLTPGNRRDEWPEDGEEGEQYAPGTLLAASAPYGVPGPDGIHVAFVTVPAEPSDPQVGRVSLAREDQDLRTSPSRIGLEQVAFDPTGGYLLLTVVDPGSGDATLQLLDAGAADLGDAMVNDHLGPAAVADLSYEGPGRTADRILVGGVQGESGVTGLWEVPLPSGDVQLLSAGLQRDALAPAVSPLDRSYLAAELYDPEANRSDIGIYEYATGSWTVVTEGLETGDFRDPRWERSADLGDRLAFMRHALDEDDHRSELCVATLEPGEGWAVDVRDVEAQLGDGRRLDTPRWSPTGGELLLDYTTTDNASGLNLAELVIYDVDGDEARRLHTGGEPDLAQWAFDGQTILIWDRSATGLDATAERTPIRLHDVATGQTRNVVVAAPEDDEPILFVDFPMFLYRNTLWY